jgi:hypothetical protein
MDIPTLRLLEQIDARPSVYPEYPDDLDWTHEIAQVRALAPIIEQIIGRACKVDDQVQDASFLADINAVRARSYIYIDGDMLNVAYTGIDPRYKGSSWWIRFFDYL